MPLPGGITTITVTGTYAGITDSPASGEVLFTPSSVLTDTTGEVILTSLPAVATLNSSGSFSVVLPCTDNPGIRPAPFYYTVTQAIGGAYQQPFTISLPSTLGSTVDMSALAPIPSMPAPAEGLYVISVNGQSGSVTIDTAGTGTVTSVAVESANGLAGSVADSTTAPQITLSTTASGILKGSGGAIAAATAGTDYLAPSGSGAALTGITAAQVGADASGAAATAQSNAEVFATSAVASGNAASATAAAGLETTTTTVVVAGAAAPTANQVLTATSGSAANWQTPQSGGMANPMTTAGDMIDGGSGGAPARLAGNTSATKNFLTSTGTGSAAQAPAWGTIAAGDVPTLNQNSTGTAANLSGTPALPNGTTATTQTGGDNSTKIATDAFVQTATAAAQAAAEAASDPAGSAATAQSNAETYAAGLQPTSGSPLALTKGGTGLSEATASALVSALGALLAANNLSDVASASSARSNLGLGTAAVAALSSLLQASNNLSDVASASTSRTNLGLGSAATLASSAVAQTANNLSDLASASTARTNLGLGTAATQASSAFDAAGAASTAQSSAEAASLPLPSGTAISGQVPVATGSGNASAWGAVSGGLSAGKVYAFSHNYAMP
jgi:hypothetical protein